MSTTNRRSQDTAPSTPRRIVPLVNGCHVDEQPVGPVFDEPHLPPVLSLIELSRQLRQERYQQSRSNHARNHVHAIQVARARLERLLAISHSVRLTLAECIRAEDKHSFATLFNAFHHLARIPSILPSSFADASYSTTDHPSESDPTITPPSFLPRLSPSSQTTLLDFLVRTRSDASFMVKRLSSLSPKELAALLPDPAVSTSRPAESVFASSQRTTSRTAQPLGFVVDRLLDDITTSAFRCPLDVLVHGIQGHIPGPAAAIGNHATELWATVCASLIADQKSGSEKIITALLDIWCNSAPWKGRDRMQLWMLETLQQGHFLLKAPNMKQTFRARVQPQHDSSLTDEAASSEAFYTTSVAALLDMFAADAPVDMIPEGVIALAHAIYPKLPSSSGQQTAFSSFLVTRWLVSSFLPHLLLLPESHGILADHYLPDIARLRIFKEIAIRAQRAVYDVVYAWRYSTPVPADTLKRVQSILARFDLATGSARVGTENATNDTLASPSGVSFISLSPVDLLTVVNALYPPGRPASLSSDRDTLRSGLHSSASSVSGFSLFRNTTSLPATIPDFGSSPLNTGSISEPTGESTSSDENLSITPLTLQIEPMTEVRAEIEDIVNASQSSEAAEWTTFVVTDDGTASSLEESLHHADLEETVATLHHVEDSEKKSYPWWTALTELLKTTEVSVTASKLMSHGDSPSDPAVIRSDIVTLFETAAQASEARCDYVSMHASLTALQSLEDSWKIDGELNFCSFLRHAQDDLNASISASQRIVDTCQRFLGDTVKPNFQSSLTALGVEQSYCKILRDKMWYTADVRTSAAYETLHGIAAALHVMGKPKRSNSARLPPNLRHFNASKIIGHSLPLKSVAQILEVLSATPEHGGPNKLSEEQAKAALAWIERNQIQLLCPGEERIHKLCMEIRRCAEQLTMPSAAENPMLWSSPLYSNTEERRNPPHTEPVLRNISGFTALTRPTRPFENFSLQTAWHAGTDAMSMTSHTLSSVSSREYFDSKSPTLTNKSSATFWSPAVTEAHSPSSATSVGSYPIHAPAGQKHRESTRLHDSRNPEDQQNLFQRITGLLLSDVGFQLFVEGNETDRALWYGIGGDLLEEHIQAERTKAQAMLANTDYISACSPEKVLHAPFDFGAAFKNIFGRFSVACNPHVKLRHLSEVQSLLPPFMAQMDQQSQRQSTPKVNTAQTEANRKTAATKSQLFVDGFYKLFCDRAIRPATLLRDMQFIASLLPAQTLEHSAYGTAFWNAAVALFRLKGEAVKVMVEMADGIIAHHTNNRGHGRSPSVAQQQRDSATFSIPSRTPPVGNVSRYTMSDAAYLLQITAKEGDAAAQRELATLYLTHPELMEHIIAPFTRPKDVFKEELESKWRKNQDPARCDPVTMCVAHHWMLLSSKGGDALAREYLRQREEMERLP